MPLTSMLCSLLCWRPRLDSGLETLFRKPALLREREVARSGNSNSCFHPWLSKPSFSGPSPPGISRPPKFECARFLPYLLLVAAVLPAAVFALNREAQVKFRDPGFLPVFFPFALSMPPRPSALKVEPCHGSFAGLPCDRSLGPGLARSAGAREGLGLGGFQGSGPKA